MNSPAKLGWREARWLLFDALDVRRRRDPRPALKAVPLAFPVVEATHRVRERIPEKVGLVRRTLLDGLCRFGPAAADDLDALLGLGPDLIDRVLEDLERAGAGVARDGRTWRAGPDARRLLDAGAFTRVVEHRRAFLVNGLTDELLPIHFWRAHEGCALYLDRDKAAGPVRDEFGNLTAVFAKLTDRGNDGADALRRCVASGDAAKKERVGVPAGACDVVAEVPERRALWVLAFLLAFEDGGLDVVSAGRGSVRLVDDRTASRDYLGLVLPGRGLDASQLDPHVDFDALRERLSGWPAGARVVRGARPGEVLVSVPDPESTLSPAWAGGEDDDPEARRLSVALVGGLYWEVGLWAVLRLTPGDPATAARVGLLRGIHALRAAVRAADPSPDKPAALDVKQWWDDWQAAFAADLPPAAAPPRRPLDDLLRLADGVPDTEFLDRLDALAGAGGR